MDHPFLTGKNFYYYSLIWATICVAHIGFLFLLLGVPRDQAILDSLAFNSLVFGLGLAYWFVIKFSGFGSENRWFAFASHTVGGLFIISLCIGVSNYLVTSYADIENEVLAIIVPLKIFLGLLYYSVMVLFYYLIRSYQDLQDVSELESRLETEVKQAELNMLKTQINPHFIFNSLNSISALTLNRPEDARNMVIKLSDFLRYSLGSDDHSKSSLKDELKNVALYMEIEKVRFGEKLKFEQTIDPEALNWNMPNMILQPLMENAIKYGVYESIGEVSIKLNAVINANRMIVKITNSLEQEASTVKGKGIGLKNVSNRLRLIYNFDDLLKVERHKEEFIATLSIPNAILND